LCAEEEKPIACICLSRQICYSETVNGSWSEWSHWSRRRECSNPIPLNGGEGCTGPDFESGKADLAPTSSPTNITAPATILPPAVSMQEKLDRLFAIMNKLSEETNITRALIRNNSVATEELLHKSQTIKEETKQIENKLSEETNITRALIRNNSVATEELLQETQTIQEETKQIDNKLSELTNITRAKMDNISHDMEKINMKVENISLEMEEISKDVTDSVSYCAFKGYLSGTGIIIKYDSMLTDINSFPSGGLDISTGVFTVPASGLYQITYAVVTVVSQNDDRVNIYINVDNKSLGHPSSILKITYSASQSPLSGNSYDTGSRTLLLHLNHGQTVNIFCQDCSPSARYVTFCILMINSD